MWGDTFHTIHADTLAIVIARNYDKTCLLDVKTFYRNKVFSKYRYIYLVWKIMFSYKLLRQKLSQIVLT